MFRRPNRQQAGEGRRQEPEAPLPRERIAPARLPRTGAELDSPGSRDTVGGGGAENLREQLSTGKAGVAIEHAASIAPAYALGNAAARLLAVGLAVLSESRASLPGR